MEKKNETNELTDRARHACSGREYCISETEALLERGGCSDRETRLAIIDTLVKERFIDEKRYCRAFVRDHFRHNGWGRVKISMMLKSKKIPGEAIAEGRAEIGEEEYLEYLAGVIESQKKKVRSANRYDLKGKLLRHALAKGFESHLVYDAINASFRE